MNSTSGNRENEQETQLLFPDMPDGLKRSIKKGNTILANSSQAIWDAAINDAISFITSPISNISSIEGRLTTIIGCSEKDATAVRNAALSAVHTINDKDGITAHNFVDASIQEGTLADEDADKIRSFYEYALNGKPSIKDMLENDAASDDDSLPTLRSFDISVDLKLKFDRNGISKMLPIATFHIDTESYTQEIWLQISKRQLETLINELNTALDQMKLAESITGTSNKN